MQIVHNEKSFPIKAALFSELSHCLKDSHNLPYLYNLLTAPLQTAAKPVSAVIQRKVSPDTVILADADNYCPVLV